MQYDVGGASTSLELSISSITGKEEQASTMLLHPAATQRSTISDIKKWRFDSNGIAYRDSVHTMPSQ
jgi:hypothetical protein